MPSAGSFVMPASESGTALDWRCLMAKGQVNKGKTNKPKLSVKEKQAKKKEKRAAKEKK